MNGTNQIGNLATTFRYDGIFTVENLSQKAKNKFKKNDIKGALKYINIILNTFPNHSQALLLRAEIYLENENFDSAEADLNNIQEKNSDVMYKEYRLREKINLIKVKKNFSCICEFPDLYKAHHFNEAGKELFVRGDYNFSLKNADKAWEHLEKSIQKLVKILTIRRRY